MISISIFDFEYKTKWTNGYRRNLFCDSTRPFFVPKIILGAIKNEEN
ncbi:hypothetical protein HMPREF9526_01986 [Enterococcus faecium TX0133B]|nr:hypothetical protein HMPREF9526_01986 [Enterococcus faecium TX0133B]EFR74051.1 hypothetical protein HMPREF9523_02037 [Enterococcus faecium TX0133A]KDE18023.1 hypothetical protein HMPREF2097_00936 [Enterococcus faecalis 918]